MSLIKDPVKPYAIGLFVILLIAALGWLGHFIYSSGYDARDLEYQKALEKEKTESQKKYDKLQDSFNKIDTDLATALREKKNAEDELHRRVANGSTTLRVPVICKAQTVPSGEAAAADTGADNATHAELDPTARQDYYSLRDGINQVTEQLNGCKALLVEERK